jgi:hypothetical protein
MAMYLTLISDVGTTHINTERIGGIHFSHMLSAAGKIAHARIYGDTGDTLATTTDQKEIAALKWWVGCTDVHMMVSYEQHLAREQREAESARKLAEQEAEYKRVMEEEAEEIARVFQATEDQYGETYQRRYREPAEMFQKYAEYEVWERRNGRQPLAFPDWEDKCYIPF